VSATNTSILAAAGEVLGDAEFAKRLADAPASARVDIDGDDEPSEKRSRIDEPLAADVVVPHAKRSRVDEPASAAAVEEPVNIVPLNLRVPGAHVALFCAVMDGVGNSWMVNGQTLVKHLAGLNQGITAILCEAVALPVDADADTQVHLQPTIEFNNVRLAPHLFTWNAETMHAVPSPLAATVGSYVVARFRPKFQRIGTDTMYTGVITAVSNARSAAYTTVYFPFDKTHCRLKSTEFAVVISGPNAVVALPSDDDDDE